MYLEYYVGIQLFLHTGAANAQAYEVMLSSNLSAELTAYPQQTVRNLHLCKQKCWDSKLAQ